MNNKLQSLLANTPLVLLDGAMGTMLQQNGLEPGERPELFVLRSPDIVAEIHRKYLESGSRILYTCTFGANRRKLAGTGVSPEEVITAAVGAAKQAAQDFPGKKPLIALDIGPIGEMLYPSGMLRFEEAYELFREQVAAGIRAGADLIALETMADLGEMRAAVLAAKECGDLPILATMAFEAGGRTFTGCTVESMAYTLDGLGVDALGINCSLGPGEIYPIAARAAACTSRPLVIKANAGLPDPVHNTYQVDAHEFARQMEAYAKLGIRLAGGCCGTTPAYIAALRDAFADYQPLPRTGCKTAFCSATRIVPAEGIHVIGERLNPTGKAHLQQALLEKDFDCLLGEGLDQTDAGAELLDLNAGYPGVDEPEVIRQAVEELQGILACPFLIDSPKPDAIEAGLRAFHGVGVVNSVNGSRESLAAILPVARKYGAFVIGLTSDENGLPRTAEGRLAIARRILEAALSAGIPREKLLIDCLALTASAQQEQGMETLRAIRMVKEELGLKTVLGISNISFGLPNRELLNRTFLAAALGCGLDLPILDPCSPGMMETAAAFRVLRGEDTGAEKYLARFAGRAGSNASPQASQNR